MGDQRRSARGGPTEFVRGRLLRFASVRRMIKPTPQSLASGPEGDQRGERWQ
jgi:hypothetical protein